MHSPAPPPPYPTQGEIYHALSLAFDTRQSNPKLNRLVREGDFDWAVLDEVANSVVLAPLERHADRDFAKAVHKHCLHLMAEYRRLVCRVPLDSLDRRTSLPLLAEYFFAPAAAALLLTLAEQFPGPPLARLLDPNRHPIDEVFTWLEASRATSLAHEAYPATTGTDRSNRELVQLWRSGSHLPDLINIHRISNDIEKNFAFDGPRIARDLRRWLILSRALAWLDKRASAEIRQSILHQILMNFPEIDIGHRLSLAVREAAIPYAMFAHKASDAALRLQPNRQKEVGDRKSLEADIQQIALLMTEFDADGRTTYFCDWLWARWHAQSGELEDSIAHYQRAVQKCWYRAGDQQEPIVAEALVVAARLGRKTLLNQIKNRAIAIGLFPRPTTDEQLVADWEIRQWEDKFHLYFPPHQAFPESRKQGMEGPFLPFLAFDRSALQQIRPDLNNPDRVRKVLSVDKQERRYTQLAHFAHQGDVATVEALLSAGADVDQLDGSGASALLCALQRLLGTGDQATVELLMSRTHSQKTLNSRTLTKNWTPLLTAIDHGDPILVKRLLDMGADANRPGRPEGVSPLYFTLSLYMHARDPNLAVMSMLSAVGRRHAQGVTDASRRHAIPNTDAFGNIQFNFSKKAMPFAQNLYLAIAHHYASERQKRHSDASIRQIVSFLLASGAAPNQAHDRPVQGRTPFMLAAEMNCTWAFELMLAHGGDPEQKDGAGNDSLDIAIAFDSRDVVRLIKTKPKTH